MNYRMLWYLLSILLLIEAGLLVIPAIVALLYGEALSPYLWTIAILLAVSLPGIVAKPKDRRFYTKEGFICVAAAWILMSLFGSLPFVFSGAIPHMIDAFFETASGFTTTGASILSEVEHLPRGILFWRSFTHLIGGMGVLVFMLALLPSTDGRTLHLLRAEVPGPQKGKLVPKIRQTALILYGIYLAMTAVEVAALLLTGLDLYNALVTAFATAGTGGFSVMNRSIAGYGNPAAEWVIAVFMMLFGVNFNLYFLLLTRRFAEMKKNEEVKVYLAVILVAWGVVTAANVLSGISGGAGEQIRAAFFQVMSIMSTSGFSTVDYNVWPALSKIVLVLLMLIGACAGSTAGGLKVSRVIILFKNTVQEIRHILHPHSVNSLHLDGEPLSGETSRGAANYFTIYILLCCFSTLLLSIDGRSLETNLTATFACINNIGPGLGDVGPESNFAFYSYFSKIILSLDMLIGRLEMIPMVIFFSPSSWKKM